MIKMKTKMKNAGAYVAIALFISVFLSSSFAASFQQPSIITQHPVSTLDSTTISSLNWAGYAAASGTTPSPTVTAVYGSWIVQKVQATLGSKYSSQWIGIGGFFSGDKSLIQTGTESDSGNGKTKYAVWWETLPKAETAISQPVSPGDVMSASIVCVSSCVSGTQTWTITVHDVTKGWTFAKTLSYSSSLKSAEWIEERPALCLILVCKLTNLANFGTAKYGQVYTSIAGTGFATIGATTAAIGGLPNIEISMTGSSGGAVIAQPSPLSADGSSFIVNRQ